MSTRRTTEASQQVPGTPQNPTGTPTVLRSDTYDTNTVDNTFSANSQGRVTTVQYNVPSTSQTLDNNTNPINFTGDTVIEMYSYTGAGQVTAKRLRITRAYSFNETLSVDLNGSWTYNNEGRMTSVSYPTDPNYSPPTTAPIYTYSFDGMGRLSGMVLTNTQNAGTMLSGVTYNAAGQTTNGANGVVTYNNMGQITSMGGFTYVYPAAGQNNSTNHLGGEDANGNPPNSMDAENRLIISGTQRYAYNAQNKRVWSCTASGTYFWMPCTSDTYYFYGPNGKLMTQFTPVYTLAYTDQQNVHHPATLTFQNSSNTRAYFGGRMLGDEDRLGSRGGKYFPYGDDRSSPPPANDQVKFATYTRDSATGLDYADQRYYASTYGRFMSPDPYMGSARPAGPQSWNRYAYVLGDPVNGNDADGLGLWCVWTPDEESYLRPIYAGYFCSPTPDPQRQPNRPQSPGAEAANLNQDTKKALSQSNCTSFLNQWFGVDLAKEADKEVFFDTRDPATANRTVSSVTGVPGDDTKLSELVAGPIIAAVIQGTSDVVLSSAFYKTTGVVYNSILIHEDLHAATKLSDPTIARRLSLVNDAELQGLTSDQVSVLTSQRLEDFIEKGCTKK
jgi:RHS repeat-associated protein